MANDNRESPLLPISGLIALLAALGVIIFTQVPLKGKRPYVPEVQEQPEKVRARLWEDPFLAVLEHAKAGKVPGSKVVDVKGLVSEINKRKGRVTILGVMVFGSPYAEDSEGRIRRRYGVLSGLRRVEFVPEDSEHIKYVENPVAQALEECYSQETPKSPHEEAPHVTCMLNILPYEWLERNGDRKDKDNVLLLWLNDDAFREKAPSDTKAQPLKKLARLIGELRRSSEKSPIKIKIIGPAGSTTLLDMLKELLEDPKSKLDDLKNNVKIYSATATAADSLLIKNLKESSEEAKEWFKENANVDTVEKIMEEHGIIFKRTILSDSELAKALKDELGLRGIDFKCEDHFVLVAEWDTFYGRFLPETFESALKGRTLDSCPDNVWRFSYLRGIDGRLPGEQDQDNKKQEKKDSVNKEDIGTLEQPIGRSQFDYLRRLAEKIYSLDQRLKHQRRGSVKAIGVLGSDFYDKYLVLQAIRQQLPEIVYFTTDLDARMLYADNIKWTRNLVVASSFGLRLDRKLQGDVPPFRDNYQTSVFYTVLASFDEVERDAIKKEIPRIFEIGRREPFDLTPVDSETQNSIHPPTYAFKVHKIQSNYLRYLLLLALFVCSIVLLSLTSARFNNAMKQLWHFIWRNKKLGAVLIVVMVVFFYFSPGILDDLKEEPFSIVGGVSVWPTEIVRFIVVLLSWYFIISATHRLGKNCEELDVYFGMGGELIEDKETPKSLLVKRVREALIRGTYNWGGSWDKETIVPINEVWKEYVIRSKWNYIFWRIIPILFLSGGVSCFIIYMFGDFDMPTSPVRGRVSKKIDIVTTACAILSFLILIFYVFDATRLCRRFVVLASRVRPEWSPTSLEKFMTKSSPGSEAAVGEWMVVQLIARRTDVVGKLIFRPFIILFLLLVSRNTYFDNWHTPIGLAIAISMSGVYAWSCALILRAAAEKARENVIGRLTNQLIATICEESPDQGHKERIEFVLDEVRLIQRGAFTPFMRHPAVQALFVPFGGIGGVALLQQLLERLNL